MFCAVAHVLRGSSRLSSQFTQPARSANLSNGDVSERPKVLVSKTSVCESAPRVQIPPSPRESKKEPDFQALFYFADAVGVSRSPSVNPNHKFLAVSHRSGDNFAAKRDARVQIPPSPRESKKEPDFQALFYFAANFEGHLSIW